MVVEKVSGPFSRYYVAVYACAMGDRGNAYDAYFKICSRRASSYWEAECLYKGRCSTGEQDAEAALQAAEEYARALIEALPDPEFLAAHAERRALSFSELQQLWGTSCA
jgi:hypothetical protein